MAAIPLIPVVSVVPAIGIGIGILATVKVALDLAAPTIGEVWNRTSSTRDESVVSRAPGQQAPGSTSYTEKEETKSINILSDKEVAEIEGAMKHAQIALEIDIKVAETKKSPDKELAHVAGGIRNAQHRTLKLYSFGSFSGKFVVDPPVFMVESPTFTGLFLHQGCGPGDSKGYVIYGTDEDDPPLLYILSWSKPAKGSPKVYVQAGLLPNMLKKPYHLIKQAENWDDLLNQLIGQIRQKLIQLPEDKIRQKLNELTEAHQCSSDDPETGAEAAAEIRSVYPGCSWALLGATFSRRQH